MASAYDHLFKLLIIGDSGEWARHFSSTIFIFAIFSFNNSFLFVYLFIRILFGHKCCGTVTSKKSKYP